MKLFLISLFLLFVVACGGKQGKLDRTAEEVVGGGISASKIYGLTCLKKLNRPKDSLILFLLPLERSCATCRKKSIDSLAINHFKLTDNKIFIVSASSYKKIQFFFQLQEKVLPDNRYVIIDSSNELLKNGLIHANPRIYILNQERIVEQISCHPKTIKSNLHNFFNVY